MVLGGFPSSFQDPEELAPYFSSWEIINDLFSFPSAKRGKIFPLDVDRRYSFLPFFYECVASAIHSSLVHLLRRVWGMGEKGAAFIPPPLDRAAKKEAA